MARTKFASKQYLHAPGLWPGRRPQTYTDNTSGAALLPLPAVLLDNSKPIFRIEGRESRHDDAFSIGRIDLDFLPCAYSDGAICADGNTRSQRNAAYDAPQHAGAAPSSTGACARLRVQGLGEDHDLYEIHELSLAVLDSNGRELRSAWSGGADVTVPLHGILRPIDLPPSDPGEPWDPAGGAWLHITFSAHCDVPRHKTRATSASRSIMGLQYMGPAAIRHYGRPAPRWTPPATAVIDDLAHNYSHALAALRSRISGLVVSVSGPAGAAGRRQPQAPRQNLSAAGGSAQEGAGTSTAATSLHIKCAHSDLHIDRQRLQELGLHALAAHTPPATSSSIPPAHVGLAEPQLRQLLLGNALRSVSSLESCVAICSVAPTDLPALAAAVRATCSDQSPLRKALPVRSRDPRHDPLLRLVSAQQLAPALAFLGEMAQLCGWTWKQVAAETKAISHQLSHMDTPPEQDDISLDADEGDDTDDGASMDTGEGQGEGDGTDDEDAEGQGAGEGDSVGQGDMS